MGTVLVPDRRVGPRLAVALSFAFLAGLAGLFVYALILGDEARDEAPDLRNVIVAAVGEAARSGELSVDSYHVATLIGEAALPEVAGAEVRMSGVEGENIVFRYSGTHRASGYCFPGSLRPDGRVHVEFTRC